jgi:hypothetical protein
MQFCVSAEQLRAALKAIEAAEANGFHYCLAVFELVEVGKRMDQNQAAFSDLFEKAHPTDRRLDWGRFQQVTRRYRFEDGKLIRIENETPEAKVCQDKTRTATHYTKSYVPAPFGTEGSPLDFVPLCDGHVELTNEQFQVILQMLEDLRKDRGNYRVEREGSGRCPKN